MGRPSKTYVICADSSCIWNDNALCKAKEISLSWHSIMTAHNGRQEFHKCKTYKRRELSEAEKDFFNFAGMKIDGEVTDGQ